MSDQDDTAPEFKLTSPPSNRGEDRKAKKRACQRAWEVANREKRAAYKKAYRQTHKQAITAYEMAHRKANKEAIAARKKAYYDLNKERASASAKNQPGRKRRLRENDLRRIYGMTLNQYDELLRLCHNRCVGCNMEFGIAKGSVPHVDHDHESGRVRGLLCGHCNKVLGLAKDNPEVLRNLTSYLERACNLRRQV
jgi:Recombination endonuclease VII